MDSIHTFKIVFLTELLKSHWDNKKTTIPIWTFNDIDCFRQEIWMKRNKLSSNNFLWYFYVLVNFIYEWILNSQVIIAKKNQLSFKLLVIWYRPMSGSITFSNSLFCPIFQTIYAYRILIFWPKLDFFAGNPNQDKSLQNVFLVETNGTQCWTFSGPILKQFWCKNSNHYVRIGKYNCSWAFMCFKNSKIIHIFWKQRDF